MLTKMMFSTPLLPTLFYMLGGGSNTCTTSRISFSFWLQLKKNKTFSDLFHLTAFSWETFVWLLSRRYPHAEDRVWGLWTPVSDLSAAADLPSISDSARLRPRADHPQLDDQSAEGRLFFSFIQMPSFSASTKRNSLLLPETAATFQHQSRNLFSPLTV